MLHLRTHLPILGLIACVLAAPAPAADEVYQSPDVFVAESFGEETPEAKVLWLTKPVKEGVKAILGHDYPALRIRYWAGDSRTVWILEEIGKVKLITAGIVVDQGRIERLKVLIYRESHGWEVKHPFFTDQFHEAGLDEKRRLDRKIDGIAGATLSVNALKKLAALALFLDQQSRTEKAP